MCQWHQKALIWTQDLTHFLKEIPPARAENELGFGGQKRPWREASSLKQRLGAGTERGNVNGPVCRAVGGGGTISGIMEFGREGGFGK